MNKKAISGEWIAQRTKMQWQCCDCALVHDVCFRLNNIGNLETKMTRNDKETKKVRSAVCSVVGCNNPIHNKKTARYYNGLPICDKHAGEIDL